VSEPEIKKRRPVKRWIILALIAAGIYCAYIGPSILKPISPVVSVPGEPTGIQIGGFVITNTILATLLSDLILLIMAIVAGRFVARGNLVPSGFYNFFEVLVEFTWNTVHGASSKWAKRIFDHGDDLFINLCRQYGENGPGI
jgi:F0F1-type ATP synthase membrane subunit a